MRELMTLGPFVVGTCMIIFGFLDMSPSGVPFFLLAVIIRMLEGLGAIAFYISSLSARVIIFPHDIGFVYVSAEIREIRKFSTPFRV